MLQPTQEFSLSQVDRDFFDANQESPTICQIYKAQIEAEYEINNEKIEKANRAYLAKLKGIEAKKKALEEGIQFYTQKGRTHYGSCLLLGLIRNVQEYYEMKKVIYKDSWELWQD